MFEGIIMRLIKLQAPQEEGLDISNYIKFIEHLIKANLDTK
ncbi:hypothetical protein [Thermococcus celericrescens]|nr:hypothetical protein [Thermococcus celericrescens]